MFVYPPKFFFWSHGVLKTNVLQLWWHNFLQTKLHSVLITQQSASEQLHYNMC